jgi:hypothetical protein
VIRKEVLRVRCNMKKVLRVLYDMKGGSESSVRYERRF